MTAVTVGHTKWNVDYNPERNTIILDGRGPMPREFALSLTDAPEHNSAQTQPDQSQTEVEVSGVARRATPEQRAQGELGHIDPRSVVMTPIECGIPEALRLAKALLSHIPPSQFASPLHIENVRKWVAQIGEAVGEPDD